MNLYQLKVVMQDTDPTVWRQIIVHPETPFPQLSYVLFAAFDWQHENELHYFQQVETGEVFDPEAEDIFNDDYDNETLNWPLKKVGDAMRFWYNRPADDHVLLITLEKIFPAKPNSEWPRVTDGEHTLQAGASSAVSTVDLAALNANILSRAQKEEEELYFFDDYDDDDDFDDLDDLDLDYLDSEDEDFDDDYFDEDDLNSGHHRSDN